MLFSKDWLAEYVDLPEPTEEIARKLTDVGLAIEGTEGDGEDVQFDIEVTSNRVDCMNHLGVARELAVIYGRPLRMPPTAPPEGTARVEEATRVDIEDEEGCPRFVARVVRGVKIGPSPDWLRKRLESIGSRSINNVVDVTNFILWEMGQPLHAYDLAKLEEQRLVVRRAREGETLVTLDGIERKLTPEMLVIADAVRPVGLGGVMGGADSEVTDTTTDILIEGAHFDRRRVRIAARAFGMHTDASHRFERGADPGSCLDGVTRAARLIAEIAGGTVSAGAIDRRRENFPPSRSGRLDLDRLDAFAGAPIPAADSERWLTGLGFGVTRVAERLWDVTVPTWRLYDFQPRPDGSVYEQDLFEEAIRHFGFANIPAALPGIPGADAPRTPRQILREKVRDLLAASGYAETISFAFQSPEMDAAFPSLRPDAKPSSPIQLANPLSDRYSVMRRSLLPNLVEVARFNQRRGLSAVRVFEIGTVFYENPATDVPEQPEHVALVCGGVSGTPWQREVVLDLFDLKGAVEALAEAAGVRLEVRPATLPGLLEGSAAELFRDGHRIGYFGRVAEEEGYPLYAAEIALAGFEGGDVSLQVEAPSRFPGIDADFTLTHSVETPWAEIDRTIAGNRPADLVSWEMTVRYQGQGVPEGAVNTTVHFLYNSPERSLTQEEVNERQLALTTELQRRFGWKG
ncbi:MAG TPA: phenylalanine--tRNA ligase subunit beta [Thermoanaerobaculia bacterium]|jgi:phenylalanyl-tRNA synthetase beta chain|nr:phenylalanine--tRNA ligase subunit beta [Thermoanaerobaculia bacterium]